MSDAAKTELSKQLYRIVEDATYSSKGHFNAAARWESVHTWTNILSIVLSIVAGTSAIQSSILIASIAAFCAAIVSSATMFLNPIEKSYSHRRAADQHLALRNRATGDLSALRAGGDQVAIGQRVTALADERNIINQLAPSIPGFAYKRAKTAIERGDTVYSIDKDAGG